MSNDLKTTDSPAGADSLNRIVGPLPCPFCGGPAEMNVGGFGERFVTCADDNCGGRMGAGIWANNEATAIRIWNRRPNAVITDASQRSGETFGG
jgi:hypothetical protein